MQTDIHVFGAVLYLQQIIAHSLICKLVNEWRHSIHTSVRNNKRTAGSWRIRRFLVSLCQKAIPEVNVNG